MLEISATPSLLLLCTVADCLTDVCLLVRCFSRRNHAPVAYLLHTNTAVGQLAHLGATTTTFLEQHAGHGRTDLSAVKNLPIMA